MSVLTPTDGPTASALSAEYLIGQSIEKARQRLPGDKGDEIAEKWGAQ